jgi:hypothetical protein
MWVQFHVIKVVHSTGLIGCYCRQGCLAVTTLENQRKLAGLSRDVVSRKRINTIYIWRNSFIAPPYLRYRTC